MVLETVASGLTDMDFDLSKAYLVAVTRTQVIGTSIVTIIDIIVIILCYRLSVAIVCR